MPTIEPVEEASHKLKHTNLTPKATITATGNENRRNAYSRGRRSPDALVDRRIAEVSDVLASRPTIHRCQLHKEFCKKWRVHWRTVDRIVGRAREALMERLGRSKKEFRCESFAFYESIIADPDATVTEKIRARQRIDELLGLDAPKQTQISGPDGGPIQSENPFRIEKPIKREIAQKMIEILERGATRLVENGETKSVGNGSVDRKILTGPAESNGERP